MLNSLMSNYEDEIDSDVESIINQIKNQSKAIKDSKKEEVILRPQLEKEDLEKFIIDNSAHVVDQSVKMIEELKKEVVDTLDPKLVEATSELVKAVTGAIDSLSKLKLSDDKIKGQKEIKQMEIASKHIEDSNSQKEGIYISREEILKKLCSREERPKKEESPPVDI